MEEARERLRRLRPLANEPINSLQGQARNDYDALIRYTGLLRGTNEYKNYHQTVLSVFGDYGPEVPRPATVAAYFVGCLIPRGGNTNCSALCAGNLPSPEAQFPTDSGSGLCQYSVFTARADSTGHYFQRHNRAESARAIVYTDDSGGFTESDKATLRAVGVSEVQVLPLSVSQGPTENWQRLEDLPTASVQSPAALITPEMPSENDFPLLLTLIVAVIALLTAAVLTR